MLNSEPISLFIVVFFVFEEASINICLQIVTKDNMANTSFSFTDSNGIQIEILPLKDTIQNQNSSVHKFNILNNYIFLLCNRLETVFTRKL